MDQFISWLSVEKLAGPVAGVVVGLVVLVVIYRIWRAYRRRRRAAAPRGPGLGIELAELGSAGPPSEPPTLELFNIPVRLAAIVLAPAGRGGELPPPEQLPEWIDSIVPGLAEVVVAHAPLRRRWPAQLSSNGFAHAFFASVHLPGDGGRGTPWASLAGTVKGKDRSMMVALVVRSARPNSFGHRILKNEGDWLHALSVRGG